MNEDIKDFNDRSRLVLLLLKEKASYIDRREIRVLKKNYPDNEYYKDTIINDLSKRGLVNHMNAESYEDENGNPQYKYPDLPKFYQTSEKGLMALKSTLFPSETRDHARNRRFRAIQIIGISIAAVGGLITLITFLYDNAKSFFDKMP